MRLHYFQHVWFEDLGIIKDWCEEQNGTISRTAFHEGESIPDVHKIDWLIIMGGPFNIYEEKQYPWLTQEKTFIEKVIKHKKTVLGICLGAQLISDV